MHTLLHEALDASATVAPDVELAFPSAHESIRLADLATRSVGLAGSLAAAGLKPEDRLGVLCTNESAFLLSVFAASRLGVAVCPMPMPMSLRDLDGYLATLQGIVAAAQLREVVVTQALASVAPLISGRLPGVRLLTLGELEAASTEPIPDDVGPEHELIVQFTSGSTAAPKGVRLTHRNVMACLYAIREGIQLGSADRAGIWLPLFHDMGLFGTLTAVITGVPVTVWSPAVFVKDPARWLADFAEGAYTVSPLPNFAYDYLLGAVPAEEAERYDLSRWRVAFNGAEPIAPDSLQRFLDRFAAAGFRPGAMMPVYGLAEATLAVTFPPLGRAPRIDWVDRELLSREGRAEPREAGARRARGVTGLGRPVRAMQVRIAAEDGTPSGERRVGEVQVKGASVTSGYLDLIGDVPQPFTADGWLRTGDLGYLVDGELHVTGRIKEMIIVRGDNYYPEDVEAAVRDDPGVLKRRCVAFADPDPDQGREHLVLVAETSLEPGPAQQELLRRLRSRARSACGPVDLRIVLVEPRSIPRTSSGKLQRLAARSLVT